MRLALATVIGMMLLSISLAANISGSLYSAYTFETYKDTVVLEIRGADSYSGIFTENYSVELPAGEYSIKASSPNGMMSSEEENIIISNQTHWDIILMYYDSTEFTDTGINYTVEMPPETADGQESGNTLQNLLIFSAALVAIAIILIVISQKIEKRYDEEQDYALLKDKELTKDEKLFLNAVEGNEGIMVQKEMRKLLGWSDAKTSLISKSMESQGFVKVVKKGRENIVKINEKGKEIIGKKHPQE